MASPPDHSGQSETTDDWFLKGRAERWLSARLFRGVDISLVIVVVLVCTYIGYFSWLSIERYLAFQDTIDLGSTAHSIFLIDQGQAPIWSQLTDHFSLFGYVFIAVSEIVPGPPTLLVGQTILLGISAVPAYFLALRVIGYRFAAIAIATAFLLNPAIETANWFEFHFEILAVPFVVGFFCLQQYRRHQWALITYILALSVSDVSVLCLTAWAIVNALSSRKKADVLGRTAGPLGGLTLRSYALLLAGLSTAWFTVMAVFETLVVLPGLGSLVALRTGSDWPGLGSTPFELVIGAIHHPGILVQDLTFQIGLKAIYVIVILGMFLFLPLQNKGPLVGAIPWLLLVLASEQVTFYSLPYYAYSAIIEPYLLVAFIFTLVSRTSRTFPIWAISVFLVVVYLPAAFAPLTGDYELQFALIALLFIPLLPALLRSKQTHETDEPNATAELSSDKANSGPNRALGRNVRNVPFRSPKPLSNNVPHSLWTGRTDRPTSTLAVVSLFLVATLIAFNLYSPIGPWNAFNTGYVYPSVTEKDKIADQIIGMIPKNASVIVQEHLYPEFWDFRSVSLYASTQTPADYIVTDLGTTGFLPNDYYGAPVPPYAPISQIVTENLTDGQYGVYAEADGIMVLKYGFTSEPIFFIPTNVTVSPCSLEAFQSAHMTCQNGRLVQTSPPTNTDVAWYGPYQAIPPGDYHAQLEMQVAHPINGENLQIEVTGFIPNDPNASQVLDEVPVVINSANSSTRSITESLNFSVIYPTIVQFVADQESPEVSVSLDSLFYVQTSPIPSSPLPAILHLIPRGANALIEPQLHQLIGWYLNTSAQLTPSDQYILAEVDLSEYYYGNSGGLEPLAAVVRSALLNNTFGVEAEAAGQLLLLKKAYNQSPMIYEPANVTTPPCTLSYAPTSNLTCLNGTLVQTSNPKGVGTIWYGPYTSCLPGTYQVQLTIAANRTISGQVLNLAVTIFIPLPMPVGETLGSESVNGSRLNSTTHMAVVDLDVSIPFPSQIQFVASGEPPGILVSLLAGSLRQVGPPPT
jgi:uncharacterized membrane protein